MEILNSSKDLVQWRKKNDPSAMVGFVPTMGALHRGHLSLIQRCVEESDVSIVSIFINPKQFSPDEDLNSYPKNINADLEQLKKLNVDAVFMPSADDIYDKDDTFAVNETLLSLKLEGKSRPHFFGGVLTVVSKLFNLVQPGKTFFGQKDAQQLLLVKKMVSDMKYPIDVIGCATVREKNGLAMSSRNEYLTKEEREDAAVIYGALVEAEKMWGGGCRNSKDIKGAMANILKSKNNIVVDYISIVHLSSLNEVGKIVNGRVLVSLAVFIRKVRLIDNIVLGKNNI